MRTPRRAIKKTESVSGSTKRYIEFSFRAEQQSLAIKPSTEFYKGNPENRSVEENLCRMKQTRLMRFFSLKEKAACRNFQILDYHHRVPSSTVGRTIRTTNGQLTTDNGRDFQTYRDRLRRRINSSNTAKDHQSDVSYFCFPCSCTSPVMQHRGINVTQRYTDFVNNILSDTNFGKKAETPDEPCKTSDECNKFIQVFSPCPTDASAEHDDQESEEVLLPFDLRIFFAAPRENPILHNTNSGE